ncbi:hypothetical protein [Nocardiopsis alba]|uniref:hypothetical protein n=1 Tax=Nocardiopsis alba TaxID=53437 RepID=UPI001269017F|nr:hypothetical protein [Nocardiopsis alba]
MEKLLSDPGLVQRHLDRDLSQVSELDRPGVTVDPAMDQFDLVRALRSSSQQLQFDSPIVAATQSKRRLHELPVEERVADISVRAYLNSASVTVREGSLIDDQLRSDGTRILLFQRHPSETSTVSVNLAVEVKVETDGRSYFESYGWPIFLREPVHLFGGTADELSDQALSDLSDDGVPIDRPLLLLWGARLQESESNISDQLRIRLAEYAVARADEIRVYLSRTQTYTSAPMEHWWYSACLYRSALENLFEIYLGGLTFSLVDVEDIEALDEALREVLPHAHGFPEVAPRKIPEGHWWWNLATSPAR